ncbi:hypothetical protein JXQ70_16870 [bacterium]|nr:hypothetical protein [bacterium]
MNQDQVKQNLLQLKVTKHDFSVIFSGKASARANGVYHPERHEIIIHNQNFKSDNALMYTAIHEYAHHIHCVESALPITSRSHTTKYWSIFHRLLFKAEELGIYTNIFEADPAFISLTARIKREFLTGNGNLIREFGKTLIEAQELCSEKEVSFADYLDRIVRIPRDSAQSMIRAHLYEIEPTLGYDNMRTLASISDQDQRMKAQNAFMQGETPAMVKERFKIRKQSEDEIGVLVAEKSSIENRILRLNERLREIDNRLREAEFRTVHR